MVSISEFGYERLSATDVLALLNSVKKSSILSAPDDASQVFLKQFIIIHTLCCVIC